MRSCERCLTPYKTRVEYCGLDGAPVVERDTDPLIGTSFDRYRVTERLGGGGMAVVYRARHEVIDREAAVKILFGELAADREFAERFRREAQAASRIKHPNVVEILDFGETREGMSFLVMELLHGETLNDAIQWTGPFAPRRAASVLRQLSSGLKAAHDQGFIHRDLKPGNIMLGKGGEGQPLEVAKILDFGLVLVASEDDQRLTRTGQTLGTPHYMAPEQFAGAEATVRSDLYSLGAVLHEMLAGHAPFRGSLADVVVQQQAKAPPPLPKSGGLEKLAAKLLEKDPRKRPASTDEVIASLDKLALGDLRPEDVPAKPETLDLDVAQVVEVRPMSSEERTEALDAPAPAPLVLPAPRTDNTADDVADDDRATRDGLEEIALAHAPLPSAVPPSAPLPSAETEYVVRAPKVEVSGPGRALVLAALGGGLLFSVVLLLVAGPWPALPDAAGAIPAEASAAAPDDAPSARVQAALERRGLTLEDAADTKALAPLLDAWRKAQDGGAPDDVREATAELVVAVESVSLEPALLRRKLARVSARIAALPAERRAPLEARAKALAAEIADDASEAERSRLARRIAALEALVDGPGAR